MAQFQSSGESSEQTLSSYISATLNSYPVSDFFSQLQTTSFPQENNNSKHSGGLDENNGSDQVEDCR